MIAHPNGSDGAAARPRTLIIEQHAASTNRLRVGLEAEGHDVSVAIDAHAPPPRLRRGSHDLVILACSASEMTERIRVVRERDHHVLLLAIAGAGDETDLVLGLQLGADAFVLAPYSVLEMLARISALLRRYHRQPARAPSLKRGMIRIGDIALDARRRTVFKFGEPVALTPKELGVLVALARRKGGVAKREELLEEVWGTKRSETTRTVDVHVAELRRKLEDDPSVPRYIITEWRVGYRLAHDPPVGRYRKTRRSMALRLAGAIA
jgi:DNA-binding response OmpR family regulator